MQQPIYYVKFYWLMGFSLMVFLGGCVPHSGYWEQSLYSSPYARGYGSDRNRVVLSSLFPEHHQVDISSAYGYRKSPVTGKRHWHNGIDINVPHKTLIVAPRSAVVEKVFSNASGGLTLKFVDGNNITWGMCHLHKVLVKPGQSVRRGQPIALSGGAANDPGRGNARGPHLHLTIHAAGDYIDPMVVLIHDNRPDWWVLL